MLVSVSASVMKEVVLAVVVSVVISSNVVVVLREKSALYSPKDNFL